MFKPEESTDSGADPDLFTRVPKAAQVLVATLVRSIFAQPDAASVRTQHARIVEQLQSKFPDVAAMLDEAGPRHLGVLLVPQRALAPDLVQ